METIRLSIVSFGVASLCSLVIMLIVCFKINSH
ncbi:hypothetical protein SDC9_09148 [bioreactor metagenome]|uniref:Uncharacterized protein n=1 Tax=bioreactor metagenome TaxID=1076179 RepID=A0A644TBF2_9ZZZZ